MDVKWGGKGNQMEKREDVINKKTEDERKKEKKIKIIFWEISGVKCSPCSTGTSIM
ncbi:unnamed protein product, partial [Staurois parvus]